MLTCQDVLGNQYTVVLNIKKGRQNSTKSPIQQIMFFALGIKEKSNFVTTIYHLSRCVTFFKSMKPANSIL